MRGQLPYIFVPDLLLHRVDLFLLLRLATLRMTVKLPKLRVNQRATVRVSRNQTTSVYHIFMLLYFRRSRVPLETQTCMALWSHVLFALESHAILYKQLGSPQTSPNKKQKKQSTSGIVVAKVSVYLPQCSLGSPVSRVRADPDKSGVSSTVSRAVLIPFSFSLLYLNSLSPTRYLQLPLSQKFLPNCATLPRLLLLRHRPPAPHHQL